MTLQHYNSLLIFQRQAEDRRSDRMRNGKSGWQKEKSLWEFYKDKIKGEGVKEKNDNSDSQKQATRRNGNWNPSSRNQKTFCFLRDQLYIAAYLFFRVLQSSWTTCLYLQSIWCCRSSFSFSFPLKLKWKRNEPLLRHSSKRIVMKKVLFRVGLLYDERYSFVFSFSNRKL